MPKENEGRVYDALEELGILYVRYEHPPVYTVEQAKLHWRGLSGAHCKNLFLRNKKGNRHYLVILEHEKAADIHTLTQRLGEDRLSFASAERLMRYLGLEPGAVSPFGLINDSGKDVRVVIDRDLKGAAQIYFHPNVNTATIGLKYPDFERFLTWCGNEVLYLKVA